MSTVESFQFFSVRFMSFGQRVKCRNWCWMSNLLLLFFLTAAVFYNLGHISINYKGTLTQKRILLVICTTFRSAFHVGWKNQNKHSTLNLSFNAISNDMNRTLHRREKLKNKQTLIVSYNVHKTKMSKLLFKNTRSLHILVASFFVKATKIPKIGCGIFM